MFKTFKGKIMLSLEFMFLKTLKSKLMSENTNHDDLINGIWYHNYRFLDTTVGSV